MPIKLLGAFIRIVPCRILYTRTGTFCFSEVCHLHPQAQHQRSPPADQHPVPRQEECVFVQFVDSRHSLPPDEWQVGTSPLSHERDDSFMLRVRGKLMLHFTGRVALSLAWGVANTRAREIPGQTICIFSFRPALGEMPIEDQFMCDIY